MSSRRGEFCRTTKANGVVMDNLPAHKFPA